MAYTEPVLIAKLRFADMPGLTVTTVEPTARQWKEKIAPLLAADNNDPLQWIDIFIECLDSWDLEYADGRTVPATLSGLMSQNIVFVQKVVKQWMNHGIVFHREVPAAEESTPEPEIEPDPFEGMSVQALDATA